MTFRPLSSFIPTADELLEIDLPRLGRILLLHLKSYEGLNTVMQNGRLNSNYFIAMLESRNVGLGPLPHKEPEYGARQPEITKALVEAWNWLEREGLLIRDSQQPADWFVISRRGEEIFKKAHRFEQWEKLGLDRVKSDLMQTGGIRDVQVHKWRFDMRRVAATVAAFLFLLTTSIARGDQAFRSIQVFVTPYWVLCYPQDGDRVPTTVDTQLTPTRISLRVCPHRGNVSLTPA
jgi:hypothetical protein